LKPFVPNYNPVFSELPTTLNLEKGALRPVKVFDRRLVKKVNHFSNSGHKLKGVGRLQSLPIQTLV
jgi:hypothetical protein